MKASHRILTNSIIQIFIFGILSIIYWNKSGGDIGLIFGGIIFWMIHLIVSFRWITKQFNIFFQILIGIIIGGALNIASFYFQNNYRLSKYLEKEPNEIIISEEIVSQNL